LWAKRLSAPVQRTRTISGEGIAQVVDPFYQGLPDDSFRKVPVVGQLCWVPIPYLEKVPFLLDIERADPTEHYATKFTLRQIRSSDFRSKQRLPLKLLNLRDTEELLAQRAKRRLAIIVAADYTLFSDLERVLKQRAQRHLQEQSVLVAPLYGGEGPDHPGGVPAAMMARVKALMYRQFFYCPAHGSPQVYEALVRLDRLQSVMPHFPTYEPIPLALSPEALGVLMGVIRGLFGAPDDEDLGALKELLKETLPPEAAPTH
jgi:hypothetical protein